MKRRSSHFSCVNTVPVNTYDLFPKTVRLGARSVAFIESEIDAWMVERIATRNVPNKRHQ
ncbi:helix-turn-helix transcriptional regulator [Aeromonas hydrophila]